MSRDRCRSGVRKWERFLRPRPRRDDRRRSPLLPRRRDCDEKIQRTQAHPPEWHLRPLRGRLHLPGRASSAVDALASSLADDLLGLRDGARCALPAARLRALRGGGRARTMIQIRTASTASTPPDAPDVSVRTAANSTLSPLVEKEEAAHRAAVGLLPAAAAFAGCRCAALLPVAAGDSAWCVSCPSSARSMRHCSSTSALATHRGISPRLRQQNSLHADRARCGLHIERRGRERPGGHGDGVAVVVVALDQDDSLSALSRLFRGKAGV